MRPIESSRSRLLGAIVALNLFGAAGGGSAAGYDGLDRFGRVTDLHAVSTSNGSGGAGATVARHEHGYDLSGNRTFARITQRPSGGLVSDPSGSSPGSIAHANDRSYAFGYDELQRLIGADLGELDTGGGGGGGGTGVPPVVPDPLRTITWTLDNLGNWSGAPDPDGDPLVGDSAPSVIVEGPGGAGVAATDFTLHHQTALDNRITGVLTDDGAGGSASTRQVYITDKNGSLVFDGGYLYQYDGWNRLVQVNDASDLTPEDFDPLTGELLEENPQDPQLPPPAPGPWLVRYVYDGLGRLISSQTPVVSGGDEIRQEEYRYDGVRRIQEVVAEREEATTVVPEGQPPELEPPYDIESLQPIAPLDLITARPAVWDQREYIWSAAADGYVDELCWQIDKNGKAVYVLQDANYNVIALVRSWSGGSTTGPNGEPGYGSGSNGAFVPGDLIEQYTWDPYGRLLAKDTLDPAAANVLLNRVGFQGLFFERFDGSITAPPFVAFDPATNSPRGLYYARNRWLNPATGQFTTKDVNSSALSTMTTLANLGETWSVLLAGMSPGNHYSDGMSLYAFGRGNPGNARDPLGLFGFTDTMGAGFTYASMAQTAYENGSRLFAIAGDVFAGNDVRNALWDWAIEASVDYAGGKAFDAALDSLQFVHKFMKNRKESRAAGCPLNSFAAGTLVDTPDGPRPIEHIAVGDVVYTVSDDQTGDGVSAVTQVSHGSTSLLLWVTFDTGQVIGFTPGHEVFTYAAGWTYAGIVTPGDVMLDRTGRTVTVTDVRLDRSPQPVWNFQVAGTHTYFAEGVWVHNYDCQAGRQLLMHQHHAFAKFLGGGPNGLKVLLPEQQHLEEYHGGLLAAIAAAGIHKPGNTSWEDFFNNNPHMLDRARNAMMDFTRGFDAAQGTNLLSVIWQQVASQWW